jgi:hypothetical protein
VPKLAMAAKPMRMRQANTNLRALAYTRCTLGPPDEPFLATISFANVV